MHYSQHVLAGEVPRALAELSTTHRVRQCLRDGFSGAYRDGGVSASEEWGGTLRRRVEVRLLQYHGRRRRRGFDNVGRGGGESRGGERKRRYGRERQQQRGTSTTTVVVAGPPSLHRGGGTHGENISAAIALRRLCRRRLGRADSHVPVAGLPRMDQGVHRREGSHSRAGIDQAGVAQARVRVVGRSHSRTNGVAVSKFATSSFVVRCRWR
mmetsp:Transcript_28658/g.46516  ORF Transcript_28658/g.46516 Transcript_28658/m.46516 type:complete len:211 (+) Transcript_28658:422-1054(+)